MAASEPGFQIAAAIIRASEKRPQRDLIGSLTGHTTDGPPLTIAVSREVGAQGTAVGREVGRILSWPVFDHELLEEIAKEMRVDLREIEYADERPGNWIEESLETFGSRRAVTEMSYFVHLRELIETLGRRGRCVIVGRGSARLLSPATTFRVRVQAPLEDRIAFVSREQGGSRQDAERWISTHTESRRQFYKNHFRCDPAESHAYDLVLDSSRFSLTGSAELIVQGFKIWSQQQPRQEVAAHEDPALLATTANSE